MINQVNTDRIDEAIDSFEESWSLDSRSQIRSLLGQFHLANDSTAITELIRIDIELRYAQGTPISLDEYLDEFGAFLGEPRDIAQIAFEDFRAREAYGHPVSSSRWHGLPGIDKESWFRDLTRGRMGIVPARRVKEVDEKFELALEAIGFHLIHELGRGAFSQVFLATQNELADRYVVLKVIDQAVSEPQNMAMLQHTNIVPIYSFERILSRSVICMPYAGRVTMADFLKGESDSSSRGGECLITTVLNQVHDTVPSNNGSTKNSMLPGMATPAAEEHAALRPLERLRSLGCNELAIWIFQRLVAALAHSHSRGVLHGDLKPANVLIRNDGEPALLDFNLSQTLDREDAKYAGGTLPYMSPETYRVVMGQTIAPHATSDIYSIGVMLYEFVTGRLPYPAPPSSAEVDVEPAIAARRIPVTFNDTDEVSPGLRSIIKRCLQYDAKDRYATAKQLQQDLDRESKNESLAFAEETFSDRSRKWVRRHPRVVSGSTVAAALMVLLIPLVAWSVWWRNQSLHFAAVTKLDSFSDASAETLSASMADPQRYQEHVIKTAMTPLEEFGILGPEGTTALDAPLMTPQQQAEYRDTIIRHIGQLAYADIARLRKTVNVRANESVDVQSLERVDMLLAAAAQYQKQDESRALTHLAAERARLAGDPKQYGLLYAKAEKMDFESSDNEQYLEAVRLMMHRRWPEARDILNNLAARETVPSAVRWTSLGRSQYHEAQFEAAKISYTQSIEHARNSSRLRLLRGMCYLKLNRYQLAEADFLKALELEPTLISAWIDLGITRMAQKQPAKAVEDFTAGLEHSPGHIHLLLWRCRAYKKLGNEEASERDYQDALKSDNITASSLVARARARRDRGDYQGALEDLDRANELDQRSIPILRLKANLFSGYLDRNQDAIILLDEVIEAEPSNESAIIDRAVLHGRLGQLDQSQNDLNKALVPPNTAETLYQAACANAHFPDKRKKAIALGWLSKAIQEGYGADRFENDSDLDSLRDMDGYRAIRRTVEMGNMIRAARKGREPDPESFNLDSTIAPIEPLSGSGK